MTTLSISTNDQRVTVHLIRGTDGAAVVQVDITGEPNELAAIGQLRVHLNDCDLWPVPQDGAFPPT